MTLAIWLAGLVALAAVGLLVWVATLLHRQIDVLRAENEKLVGRIVDHQWLDTLHLFLIRHIPNTSLFLFDRQYKHLVADGPITGTTFQTEGLSGGTLWQIFPDDMARELEPHYYSVFAGNAQRIQQHYRTRTYQVDFLPIQGRDGEVAMGMAVFVDVTEQKSTVAALQDRSHDLERSNKDLEQFANVASHELKSPLRRISGFAELLADEYEGLLSAEADEYINHIIEGTEALRSVIESLLTYSRVTSDKSNITWVNLNDVFEEALRNLYAMIKERRAAVTCTPLPERVLGDRTLLRQLFENLIGNAIKFNTTGRTPQVMVSARRDLLHWEIHVRDNGPGLDPRLNQKVFAMFQRIHPEVEGSGIGLALCKKIVGIHRGKIWYTPAEGGGTTFVFSLSARSPDEALVH